MAFGDVIDQLHDHDRLADARAAERADFAALGEGTDEVDDFNAGLEDVGLHVLVGQLRRLAVNRVTLRERNRPAIIDRIAGHVKDAAQRPLAHRHGDRAAGVGHGHAALETFGPGHRDGANPFFAEVLLHFEGELVRVAVDLVLDLERVVDPGKFFGFGEVHVDDGTDDLDNITSIHKRSDPRGELPGARERQASKGECSDKRKERVNFANVNLNSSRESEGGTIK